MNIRNRITDFRMVKASELRPNPRNWRKHPEAQQNALRGILAEVGYVDALLARTLPDGSLELVDGHLRAETTPDQEVPVLVVDLDEDEAAKVLATFDPLGDMAEANAEALAALLGDVETNNAAVQAMLDGLAEDAGAEEGGVECENDAGPQTDRAEELRVKWGVEAGQLWVVGRHRLMCGDSTCAEDVAALLRGGNQPALMVTDPPYGVDYDAGWRDEAAAKGLIAHAARRVGKVQNDDRVDWADAFRLFPGDVFYTWSPPGDHLILTGLAVQAAGYDIRYQIIWAKPHFVISRGHYHWQHEACWYAVKKGRQAHWCGDRSQTSLWEIALDKNVEGGHSTQKPVECMARPIRNHEGDVYDPFLGSGTTMVAAQNLNRRCFGIEISPAYCAVILQRMQDAFPDLEIRQEQ